MSRKPSKFRKRKREQREKREAITVDIETRSLVIDGHFHVGDSHGVKAIAVFTGDYLVHEPVLHTDLVPYDLTKARKIIDDYSAVIARAIKDESNEA